MQLFLSYRIAGHTIKKNNPRFLWFNGCQEMLNGEWLCGILTNSSRSPASVPCQSNPGRRRVSQSEDDEWQLTSTTRISGYFWSLSIQCATLGNVNQIERCWPKKPAHVKCRLVSLLTNRNVLIILYIYLKCFNHLVHILEFISV